MNKNTFAYVCTISKIKSYPHILNNKNAGIYESIMKLCAFYIKTYTCDCIVTSKVVFSPTTFDLYAR